MTASQQRHDAILGLIASYTAANTGSKKTARRALINEGIYTKKGALRVEFGGTGGKAKPKK